MEVGHLSFVRRLVRINLLSTMTRSPTFVGRCDNALAEPHRWWEGPNYEGQAHKNGGCYSVRSYRRRPIARICDECSVLQLDKPQSFRRFWNPQGQEQLDANTD
jgi:hypothetical protein